MTGVGNVNPFLITDFYKLCHMMQYPDGLTSMTSYMVPRFSRLAGHFGIDHVTLFGITEYVNSFVFKEFNENFFDRKWEDVEREIEAVLRQGLSYPSPLITDTLNKIKKLHAKRYLPVCIHGLPEGADVPMGCPCIEVTTTDPELPWVGQVLEASMSAALWHPMVSATIARHYRVIAEVFYDKTVDNGDPRTAMCDFSMRGQESVEAAVASSAGWLTAMFNSSTVAARHYLSANYSDGDSAPVYGLTSTEHSVMCAHAAVGQEEDAFKHLFSVYKDISFAAVCDSYNFWNVLVNILPKFKDVIDERGRRGKFIGVRHDSADPVEAVCGIPYIDNAEFESVKAAPPTTFKKCYLVDEKKIAEWNPLTENWNTRFGEPTAQEKGIVQVLYEKFGGYVNSKGYKVLNPGVKAVYGDSITVSRALQIYRQLEAKGFAANNVSLGVGSFSFQCIEDIDGNLYPFTRDTFSIAMKCTAAKRVGDDGTETSVKVYKDPYGFSEKKSLKGLCRVDWDDSSGKVIGWEDQLDDNDEKAEQTMPVLYFIDGRPEERKFADVRSIVDKSVGRQLALRRSIGRGAQYFNTIRTHMMEWAASTKANNFVVGLSGGKDSTVVAMLISKVFGPSRLYGVLLPVQRLPREARKANDDTEVAWDVARLCGIASPNFNQYNRHVYEIPIESPLSSITMWTGRGFTPASMACNEAMRINLPARIRMACLFAVGQQVDGRVINTSNLSEDTVGYATQFGDNAGCYAPLQDMTVTEVRELGMWLAVCAFGLSEVEAKRLIFRTPADGLQEKSDEDRLGFTYSELDDFIRHDKGSDEFKARIVALYKANKFKTDIVQMPKPLMALPNYVKSAAELADED